VTVIVLLRTSDDTTPTIFLAIMRLLLSTA